MNVFKTNSPYKMVSIQKPDGTNIEFAARKIRGETSFHDFTVPARYQVLYYTKGEIENKESGSYINITSEDAPYKEENVSIFALSKVKEIGTKLKEREENAEYIVYGRKYEKDGDFYKICEEKEFHCPHYVKDIDDASRWMLETNPSYYLGCTIKQNIPYGKVCMVANPRYFELEFGQDLEEVLEYMGNQYGVLVDLQAENNMDFMKIPDVDTEEIDFDEYYEY